ncbi:hypothetical protein M758_1G164000 [Ceratodon purpureus]|uniref:Uncharacterized protein n=1 Tax=Ceratodon purpureus TaxID=3225 RepID=A0A8T0J9B3_CERPU|nr:hypothetical protein KC19_1G168200 [Ceratodon purpureus]KAG0630238.1 hypothetical protein M758_1G164000 [Ceratodon purpureus]
MAPLQHSWSTTLKLALPLLVAMSIVAATSISGAAAQVEHDDLLELAEAAPLAKAAGRGRFLSSFDDGLPVSGRRHLNQLFPINLCGTGTSDQCKQKFPFFKKPLCCKDVFGNSACWDTGILFDKCGSCTNKCAFGQICCNGVCSNLQSDPNNCGVCGKVCAKGVPCIKFMCGYNGKPF